MSLFEVFLCFKLNNFATRWRWSTTFQPGHPVKPAILAVACFEAFVSFLNMPSLIVVTTIHCIWMLRAALIRRHMCSCHAVWPVVWLWSFVRYVVVCLSGFVLPNEFPCAHRKCRQASLPPPMLRCSFDLSAVLCFLWPLADGGSKEADAYRRSFSTHKAVPSQSRQAASGIISGISFYRIQILSAFSPRVCEGVQLSLLPSKVFRWCGPSRGWCFRCSIFVIFSCWFIWRFQRSVVCHEF